MQKLAFDRDWRFHLGTGPGWIHGGAREDADWTPVDLPHDWSIELERAADAPSGNDGGYFPTGVGWYQKRFRAPDAETVLVEFEGVYMNAEVWLDEHYLGRHPYGYTTFRYDLTPYLGRENVMRVLVDNSCQPNSRWYSGSGIYRHVWLWTGGRVRVEPWDVCVTNGVSHLADNVVLLEYLRENSTVRRVLTVLKTRASGHEPESREYTISPEGIALGPTVGTDSSRG